MRLEHIVIHNLRRRKGRAIFLVVGLLIGVATVVTLLSLTEALAQRAQHELENFGANIIIAPHNDALTLNYGGVQLGGVSLVANEIEQKSLANIDSIPNRRNIATIAPKVLGSVEIQGQRVLMMGIDPVKEMRVKRWWSITGRQIEQGRELLIGNSIATRFRVNMGDSLEVNGEAYTVVGLLAKTGSQDDQLVIAPLSQAQAALGKTGQISMVEIAALCHDCPVDEIVNQLQTALPGTDVQAVQQVVKTRMHALDQFRLFAWGVTATVIVIGALLVFVTMMGAISERTREIGIFRAIGYRRRHVLHIVLMEAVMVSALAGVLGYITGVCATLAALPLLDGGEGAVWHWNPVLAFSALGAAVLVGVLASLQPALRASRLEPSEALRAL